MEIANKLYIDFLNLMQRLFPILTSESLFVQILLALLPILTSLGLSCLWIGLCTSMAINKGRNPVAWAISGFLFGLIAVLIILYESDLTVTQAPKFQKNCYNVVKKSEGHSPSHTWECPKCGEMNNSSADHCINCFEKRPF